MDEKNIDNSVGDNENRIKIKSFNRKRRITRIVLCVVMLGIGLLFLVAGVQAPGFALGFVLGLVSIICGVTIILWDYFAQKDVYEVFTPEYYVHIKNGTEGERVYWDTVYSVEYSRLVQYADSITPAGNVNNFIIDYKVKDASGNYVLKRILTYVPPEKLSLVQGVIPFRISGGNFGGNSVPEPDGNVCNADPFTEYPDKETEEDVEENPVPENAAEQNPVEENAGEEQFGPEPDSEKNKPYIKMPGICKSMLIYGAILVFLSILAFVLYAFIPTDFLIVCPIITGVFAIICIEYSTFNLRAVYGGGRNPYKVKLTVFCAIIFSAFFIAAICALMSGVDYLPYKICSAMFVIGSIAFFFETLYFAIKK